MQLGTKKTRVLSTNFSGEKVMHEDYTDSSKRLATWQTDVFEIKTKSQMSWWWGAIESIYARTENPCISERRTKLRTHWGMLKGLGRNIWVKPFKIITTRDLNKEGGQTNIIRLTGLNSRTSDNLARSGSRWKSQHQASDLDLITRYLAIRLISKYSVSKLKLLSLGCSIFITWSVDCGDLGVGPFPLNWHRGSFRRGRRKGGQMLRLNRLGTHTLMAQSKYFKMIWAPSVKTFPRHLTHKR